MGPQFGMNTVRGNDNIGFSRSTIGERHPGEAAVLLEAPAAVAGMDHAGGQGTGEHFDEISAVHPERRVPARGVRDLNRRDRHTIVAAVLGPRTDARTPFFHRRLQSDPLQMPHAVGGQEYAGPDLADHWRLLINCDGETLRRQRISRKQAANSASHDHDIKPGLHHSIP